MPHTTYPQPSLLFNYLSDIQPTCLYMTGLVVYLKFVYKYIPEHFQQSKFKIHGTSESLQVTEYLQ